MKMDTAKTWFWIALDAVLLLAAINLIFFVMPALSRLKDSFASARTVTVSAQGKATATPDEAEISFSVLTQGSDPKSLSDNNNTKMGSVISFLQSQNIATSDIATTNYNLQPNYQWNRNYQNQTIIGYTLTQTVQVKIRDLTKVANVLGGLAPLGVNEIGGVNFTFQDQNKFVSMARADALQKAQEEAKMMAQQAGASLGAVVTVSENANVPIPFMGYAQSAMSVGAGSAPVAPTLEPGSQDVTDNVSVTYALE